MREVPKCARPLNPRGRVPMDDGLALVKWAWSSEARGPQKREARGICRICHGVNPALALLSFHK
jgi:hypothetical protein